MDVDASAHTDESEDEDAIAQPVLINGRTKADILHEAINATGGPNSQALGKIKNYIDLRFPSYPWNQRWYAEIQGAKSAAQTGCVQPSAESSQLSTTETAMPWDLEQLDLARQFVDQVADGSLERADRALLFMAEIAPEKCASLSTHLQLWSRLLDAVDGSEQMADKVLQVLFALDNGESFPRLAPDTLPKVA